jgi:hypothetical protein
VICAFVGVFLEEGKSFTEGKWNDCHLFGEPMKIGRQQEGDRSRKRGHGFK